MCPMGWMTVVLWFISCQGQCPDRLWGLPSLALNRYWSTDHVLEALPRGVKQSVYEAITHLHTEI
jgi:hypothetical protein